MKRQRSPAKQRARIERLRLRLSSCHTVHEYTLAKLTYDQARAELDALTRSKSIG